MNFCILGAGAWGTAVAIYLSKIGHVVTLVPRRVEQALSMSSARENQDYLEGVPFDPNLQIGSSLKPALMESDYIFFACPSHALRETCQQVIEQAIPSSPRLRGALALCKGLEPETNLFAHEVMSREFGSNFSTGYLTGPSHAEDIATGKPAAMVLAINGSDLDRKKLQSEISSAFLRIYRSDDRTGVALGSCIKNVYAIATGISDGLGLGDNARAALLTRSMNEMISLGKVLGASNDTFFGLSGFGDLVGTCMGQWSRNRNFGLALTKENQPEKILTSQKTVVEGYLATECFYNKCKDLKLEMPILKQVHAILYSGKNPSTALKDLMTRDLKAEVNQE